MWKVTVKSKLDGEKSVWGEFSNWKETRISIHDRFVEAALWGKKFEDTYDDKQYRQSLVDEAHTNAFKLLMKRELETDECTFKLSYIRPSRLQTK